MNNNTRLTPYLTMLGVWALAFGCSVGQGAFVMPGTTFLPIAGPVGTAVGIGLGAVVMLVLAWNYHFLMNRFPDSGGTYTYTKKCFGYDHGFLSAWFLLITYIAILWANASALPIIARTFLGSTFQFGFDYVIADFHIYMGEILLAVAAMTVAAVVCFNKRLAVAVQTVMGILLILGAVICFIAAVIKYDGTIPMFTPHFSNEGGAFKGTFTILALAPWAYAGFESVSHSAAEVKFPIKRTFMILFITLMTAAVVYIVLALMASLYTPDGISGWPEYIRNLGDYSGIQERPVFYAAQRSLGTFGAATLGIAALFGIFTGLTGNFIALSRLMNSLAEDKMLPEWFGKLNRDNVPHRSILVILFISFVLPFFGRTAISWIVDVTTVGATIAYAFASASAYKAARDEGYQKGIVMGAVGLVISLYFVLAFLVPNMLSVKTLATESYLILATWSLLGFMMFYSLLRKDEEHRLGRSNVAFIVMFAVIMFAATVWMQQSTDLAIEKTVIPIQSYYTDRLKDAGIDIVSSATRPIGAYIGDVVNHLNAAISRETIIQMLLIFITLVVLFMIYARIQKREKQVEVEKALAEESSRAKTSFLSNMSHEIRTPMNAIIGLGNIALRDPDLSQKTRERLEKIEVSAKHLLGLINDILDMSRIESGRMVLKDDEFSFREFMDQVNVIINGQCMDKKLEYKCNLIGQINDYFIGDDLKLKQVLINILGNSVKFTEPGGAVILSVEQISQKDGVCRMRFKMQDTGIGMDKEYIPKIFEAFSQEDATTTNRYGGSGLGMAITKNFVELMNGTIDVKSEKGIGSVFTVTVDLKASGRDHKSGLKLPDNIRAMIVDDDEIDCEHAEVVLKSMGIEAESCTSAEDAIKAMKDSFDAGRPYTLLLTDYKMPDMNGRELAHRVREFDGNSTAIVMLTGYSVDIIEDEVKEYGVDAVVAKPIFTDRLMNAIMMSFESKNNTAVKQQQEQEQFKEGMLAGLRVLMAEDVDANAEILEDLLVLEDVETERANNGQIALEMFESHPEGYYDAILMDVRMPVMDGLAATRAIRALSRSDAAEIPIIAMTANVFDEDVQHSLEAGMNAHLAKPVEPDKLYTTLAEFIKK